MKRSLAIILALVLAVSAMSACSININFGGKNENPTEKNVDSDIELPTVEIPTVPELPTEVEVGKLEDYVGTAKEKELSFGDGNKNTLRIPEIKLDSADAKKVNAEIDKKFADAFASEKYAGIVKLDYEGYLNGSTLSVAVTAKIEGGNTDGLAYNFDVTSGKRLDNKALCAVIGKDYEDMLSDLGAAMEDSYDERFGKLPQNDTERAKTFAKDNLEASTLYLNKNGDTMALCMFYAAVGGGQFMTQVEL